MYMTCRISMVAKHKCSSYDTIVQRARMHNSGIKHPSGHGYHVSDRKQMACWGKKRQKEGMPKKASEKCFSALSTASMSPSIIHLS